MTPPQNFVQPPHLATWLVNLFASTEEAESILGDLIEEFFACASKSGVAAARSWYWRQTVKSIAHLLGSGFRAAPWSTIAAAVGGFLLQRFVSGLPERAIFAVLHRYRVYDYHFSAYVFFATDGIAIGHVIAAMLVGAVIALAAKGREMVATTTLALLLGAMTVVAYFASVARHWPMGDAMVWMLWQSAVPLAIVIGGALVRTRRAAAAIPHSP